MMGTRGGPARCLGTLLALCLAAPPAATACPRLCACYVPTEVHCTFRYFTAVPPHIPPNVERINLGYNSLLQLTETDFSGLEKLELLMLHSNEINTIPDKVFSDLYSLQVLKMSYNKVRVLQQDVFYGLKSLVRLHMDHNKIEFVNPNIFYGLTSLRLVHLEGNLLKQLHPDTFVTLRYSQIFKISFMKHIYLSDNVLTSLPHEMFSYLPELESIYLHGNPWSCDCRLQRFAEWAEQRAGVIKCKKDRSSGAQQCPLCASPEKQKGKSLVAVPGASLACRKPAIHDSLKSRNLTVPGDGDSSSVSPKDFIAPLGSMVLNMTDQAGSRGNLVCNIQKPKELSPISLDRDGNSTVLKTSFSAFLVCDIDYQQIQQLWGILALYSNSPLKLERNVLAPNMPSYKYKQIHSEKDELFTNIEAELRAEPSWLMQSQVALQLDRTATTLSTLHIQYFTDTQIILPNANKNQARNNWTIISRDNQTQTEHTVLVGGTVQLECQATGQPAPAVEWILADGSKVRAPHISEDGRIMVVETGTLTLQMADTFDTGLYHCIGTNGNDADALTFRITVVDPYVEHNSINGAHVSAFVGSTLDLPCTSTAVPDAAVSWVLPECEILHHSVRNKHVFDNGTLRIQGVTERDSGYYRCVAANQYGVDLLVLHVLVREDETTLQTKHVAAGEWDEGDGSGHAVLAPAVTQNHPVAALEASTARAESAAASKGWVAQSAQQRNSYGRTAYRLSRDRTGRRFRGHRRQFGSSARRVDPQRWAAFLEKTKRNSTLVEKQEVATKPPIEVRKFSEAPGDEEETSGDVLSPEEFMIPVTARATAPGTGRAMGRVTPAAAGVTTGSTPARKTSLLGTAAVTALPSPFSQTVSSDSRGPQTHLNPTITNSWERSDLSQISANGIKQSTVPNEASRTSTLLPAAQRLVYSEESNNRHLKSVSMAPETDITDTSKSVFSQSTVAKLHGFTEFIDKISTKTDQQISVVTVSEPSLGLGHTYVHRTQKRVTPEAPLASAVITHQQIQNMQDVTTRTPQTQQQHGKRRKISGRRRLVRPGRIPSMKEHKYSFGRPGSVRGNTAVAADVQLNIKYESSFPTLDNVSSSIHQSGPAAPLSSPSALDMPLEQPTGAPHHTASFRGEERQPGAGQTATVAVVPLVAEDTQDAPQWKSEPSAPFQTNTDRVQPFSISLPATAIHTAHVATEMPQTVSTTVSSALQSVSPNVKPRTSQKNSQRGNITWEHRFGNGAQQKVTKKLPKPWTDVFPSTEVPTVLPETTAASSMSKTSPLHLMPVSTGGNHSSAHYGNGNSEDLPTAKPQSYSRPATTAAKDMDVMNLKPAVIPIITPQTDTKITKSKVFRVGRKRGQRRKKPLKTPALPSVPAGRSTAMVAAVPAATAVARAAAPRTVPIATAVTRAAAPPTVPIATAVTGAAAPPTVPAATAVTGAAAPPTVPAATAVTGAAAPPTVPAATAVTGAAAPPTVPAVTAVTRAAAPPTVPAATAVTGAAAPPTVPAATAVTGAAAPPTVPAATAVTRAAAPPTVPAVTAVTGAAAPRTVPIATAVTRAAAPPTVPAATAVTGAAAPRTVPIATAVTRAAAPRTVPIATAVTGAAAPRTVPIATAVTGAAAPPTVPAATAVTGAAAPPTVPAATAVTRAAAPPTVPAVTAVTGAAAPRTVPIATAVTRAAAPPTVPAATAVTGAAAPRTVPIATAVTGAAAPPTVPAATAVTGAAAPPTVPAATAVTRAAAPPTVPAVTAVTGAAAPRTVPIATAVTRAAAPRTVPTATAVTGAAAPRTVPAATAVTRAAAPPTVPTATAVTRAAAPRTVPAATVTRAAAPLTVPAATAVTGAAAPPTVPAATAVTRAAAPPTVPAATAVTRAAAPRTVPAATAVTRAAAPRTVPAATAVTGAAAPPTVPAATAVARAAAPPTVPVATPVTGAAAPPTVPAATAVTGAAAPPTVPTSPAAAQPPPGSVTTGSGTATPALGVPNTPAAPEPLPTAATRTSATPVTRRDTHVTTQPATTSSPRSHVTQSPPSTSQPPPLRSELSGPMSTGPAPLWAASGSDPARHSTATAATADTPHQKTAQRVFRDNRITEPTFPAGTPSGTRAPAAPGDIPPPRGQRPPPLPALVAPAPAARATLSLGGETPFWQEPSAKVTRRGDTPAVTTPTALKPPQIATPRAPVWGRDRDSDSWVKGWVGKRRDQGTTTNNPPAWDSFSRNHLAKPRIIGGGLAAFTVLANSDAFLPCEATGNPRPTIQWTKIPSGTEAAGSRGEGRWTVFANGTLAIARAGLGDRGQYLCTAGSPLGTARLLATLAVLAYPPRIAGARRLLTARPGQRLALRCPAEGRPPPSISWLLANQTHLSGSSPGNGKVHMEPDGTLVIEEVTVYDRGLYTCTAKNPAGTDTLAVKLQVVAAPPAILEEKRQRVEGAMGENLKLPCSVQGTPQPTVHWVLSDGTVVKPLQLVKAKLFLFANGTLHISNMGPSDSGNYECIATSSTGSERRVVSLVVEHRDTLPKIATASQEMTQLNFGDKLLLNCTATGEPRPRIIWRLPSKALVDQFHRMGSRIRVYPNGSLVIEAVTEKDAGDYLCVARNKIGDDLILMKVSITTKPAKIDQKQYFKKLVPYGKDFKVDCKASGSPTPEISWSLPDGTVINNVMLADDSGHRSRRYILFDNGTLYLNKAGVTEGGDYTCYAQNTLGRDEMKVHVTVIMAAPQIKHNYKTYIKAKAGDTALLDCEAVGEPKPKIFWLLPSSDMISSSTARHILHGNGSLSVSRVTLLDAGEYMCVARNPGGDDTKLYKLDVVAKPPIINGIQVNKTIMKVTAVRHAKKHIDCRAEGTPPPQIMWIMPDNIFLTAPYYGSRIAVHKNGTLEIRNIRPSDTAEFICVARNDAGESMLVVQLEVLEMLRRPMFKNPFNEKIIATPGKTTTLNCSVDGNPPPDISWMLPNGTWFSRGIRTSQFLTGSTGTLTISSPDRDTAGRYRCAARNKVGYIEKLIVLELGQKPTILTGPEGPVTGVSGQSLSLHCLADGRPKPSTAWTLPGGRVLDRPQINGRYTLLENGTLLVREATTHDRGNYVCKAHNSAGEDSVTIPVVIAASPPRITRRPPRTVRTLPGAAVQLRCAALGTPTPHISWELPDGSVLSAGHPGTAPGHKLLPPGTLLIPSPRPRDSGTYMCAAKNQLGSDFAVTYLHVI